MIEGILFDCLGVLCVDGVQNKELLGLCKKMRPRFKIGMFTNMSAKGVARYFAPAELQTYFDAVITRDTGLQKPMPEAYVAAANYLGLNPKQCVLVDDDQSLCQAARSVGMQAVQFELNQQVTNELGLLVGRIV